MSLSCLRLCLAHGAHSQCGLSNGDVAGANGPVLVDTNEPGCNYVDTQPYTINLLYNTYDYANNYTTIYNHFCDLINLNNVII